MKEWCQTPPGVQNQHAWPMLLWKRQIANPNAITGCERNHLDLPFNQLHELCGRLHLGRFCLRQHGTFHPLCSVFPRRARKNRTPKTIKYRSAEGKKADRVSRVNEDLGTRRSHMSDPIIAPYGAW